MQRTGIDLLQEYATNLKREGDLWSENGMCDSARTKRATRKEKTIIPEDSWYRKGE